MARRSIGRGLLAVLLLAGAACGPDGGGRPPPAATLAEGTVPCRTSAGPAATGNARFIPPTRRAGEVAVLPLVFPDGTTAELRYPPSLDLARLGVWPGTSGALENDPGSGRDLMAVHGDAAGLKAGTAPVACYRGAGGAQVELWRSQDPDIRYWLLFRFGAWTVALWDGNAGRRMSHLDRAAWARSLVGRQTGSGWLLLRGRRPLRLGADHDGDVRLRLGDVNPRAVLLWPVRCRPSWRPGTATIGGHAVDLAGDRRSWFASWCLPDAPMAVHAHDSDGTFGRAVIQGLQVRDVRHTFPPGRYHIVP
jgi:hypothetical protein